MAIGLGGLSTNAVGQVPSPDRVELIALTWNAPAPCPSGAYVTAEMERLLRSGNSTARRRSLVANAHVWQAEQGRWMLSLKTGEGQGERTLEGDTCEQLADAAALMLAIKVSTESEDSRVPLSQKPLHSEAAWNEQRANLWAVRAMVMGDRGALPNASIGPGVAVSVSREQWRGEVQASFLFPKRALSGPLPNSGYDVELLAGGARLCMQTPSGAWEAGICAGPEVGRMHVTSVGVPDSLCNNRAWVTLLAGADAAWVISEQMAIRARVEGGPAVRAPLFFLDEAGNTYQPSRWVGRAWLGAEFRFFH